MTIAFIGDCHALHKKFKEFPDITTWGINGLPVWDIKLKEKIDEIVLGDFEKIYFSCCYPLMGFTKKSNILKLYNGFLNFNQKERGFINRDNLKKLSTEEKSAICDKYIERLKLLTEKDSRIKLIPITILWHEVIRKSRLDIPPLYDKVKQEFNTLDISWILNSKFDFVDKFGQLHPFSMEKVISIL